MTQPTNYTPTTDFSQQESINASGRSTVNTAALDAEFANIETTLDQTVSNLSLIQRDDGRLKDVCVEVHTISPEVLNLIGGGYALRGLWAVATTYAVNDLCSNGAYTYVCRTAHASGGSFDGQYWTQFGFTSGADAAAAAAAAQNSATSAAGSATAAGNSATAAAASASSVSGSAAAASSSASIATNKAGEAAGSATAAGNSAAAAAAAAASLGSPIPVSNGGTGATTAALARAAIGAAPLDSPAFSGNGSIAGTFSMGSAFGFRNYLINAGCQVIQRPVTALLNASLQYGQVDRYICNTSATTVTSGTLLQVTGAPTVTGKAVGMYQVSTTGAGSGGFIQRIEAANSTKLNGRTVTFSGVVYQDTGAPLTIGVALSKATALDNFAATSAIGATASTVVPSGIWTKVVGTFTLGASDGANGIAVSMVWSGLSALTNKSFYTGDWQLEEGSIATPFENRPYGLVLALCQRYYQSHPVRMLLVTNVTSGVTYYASQTIPTMRVTPTVTNVSSVGTSGFTSVTMLAIYPDSIRAQGAANVTAGAQILSVGCDLSADL